MNSSAWLAPVEPRLPQIQAYGLLIAYCLIYVLPLYASSSTRAAAGKSRDDPQAIRARIYSVTCSTVCCSATTFMILRSSKANAQVSPWHLMGYWPIGIQDTVKSLLLTGLLFSAPLYECILIDGYWSQWLRLEPLGRLWREWPMWRNMVAGPITEECLFRSAAVPLLLLTNCSLVWVIFASPLIFGLAHLHHFYEFRITHPKTPLVAAIARSVLQFSYTTVFGAYATFLFLRTGSLVAVVAVHTFCNSMGLPRVWGVLEPYWLPTNADLHRASMIKWTIPYYVLLVVGALLWWSNLYALTDSYMAIATF